MSLFKFRKFGTGVTRPGPPTLGIGNRLALPPRPAATETVRRIQTDAGFLQKRFGIKGGGGIDLAPLVQPVVSIDATAVPALQDQYYARNDAYAGVPSTTAIDIGPLPLVPDGSEYRVVMAWMEVGNNGKLDADQSISLRLGYRDQHATFAPLSDLYVLGLGAYAPMLALHDITLRPLSELVFRVEAVALGAAGQILYNVGVRYDAHTLV